MDIEATEYAVLPEMINRNVLPLIDELFVEFHFRELHQDFPRAAAHHSRKQSVALLKQLRELGVYCHEHA